MTDCSSETKHLPRYEGVVRTIGNDLFDKIQASKVLVVGAGGIGCELLKNLVLIGFPDIEIVRTEAFCCNL